MRKIDMALLLLLLTIALAISTMGVAKTGQAKPASPPERHPNRIVVDAHDTATLATLHTQGATLLVDYGAFTLWDITTLSTANSAHLEYAIQHNTYPTDLNTIYLRTMPLDTTSDTPMPNIAAHMQQTRGVYPQFWMLQFIGPIKDAWLTKVADTGTELVAYIPNNAYVIWADGNSLANLDNLAMSEPLPFIHWMGPYHPFYRLEPTLQHTAQNQTAGVADAFVDVTVQLYATDTTQQSLDKLMHLGGTVYQEPANILHFVNISLQLPARELETIATWPDVFNIEPWSRPHMLDEIQGQLMANNVTQAEDAVVPAAPGYLEWLNAQGFPTDPERYPIIDFVDSGLDTGNADYLQHPDFYEFGDKAKNDRITSNKNCTWESSVRDPDGHGTINVGIAGAYNNLTGIPYQDEQGYRIGLGISPYGRFASTRVFDSEEYFDASNCGNTLGGVIATSFESGAVLTSNSWGSDYTSYNADTQAYDSYTRDATTTLPGNQEMLHIFSAGNAGPETTSVGTPGLAKNVLTVGATNSVRDNGVEDGCGHSSANNAHQIASFSSRGPTSDKRAKPDVVAPGTHIQGPASQDTAFGGWGVCGAQHSPYYPVGQTLYTWSTGTSHAAPAVAGAASLLYEYYDRMLNPGQQPSPAMVKALLINSTTYLATEDKTLPGQGQGWGTLNMSTLFDSTPRTLVDQEIVFNTSGQAYQTNGIVADSEKPLRISLVWSDAPGSTTGNAYVNNLDLEVTIGGRVYRGNVFDGGYSITGGTFDARNNVENVFLAARAGDFFTVRVIAANIVGDGIPGNIDTTDQDFALVITNDSTSTQTSANLVGTITDATTSAPLPQAQIAAIHTSHQAITITTQSDIDGTFSIRLPEGTYTLNTSAYGYQTHTESNITLTEETTTYNRALQTRNTRSTVQGYVHDDAGRPLYAHIQITSEGYVHTLLTDPETGGYAVPLVPKQPHTLTVQAITGQHYQQRTLDTLASSVYASETSVITPSSQTYTHDFALHVDAETCNAPGYHKPTIFLADFEDDADGFTTSWTAAWEWGIPTSGPEEAFDGSRVWGTNLSGNYPSDEHSSLVSPSIDLSNYQGQSLQLFWWQWLETEEAGYSQFDYASVELSNDGGTTWVAIYGPASGALDMAWTRHSLELEQDYLVADFRMRFLLHSDSSVNKQGFYIDHVGIQPVYTEPRYAEDFEASDGGFTPGAYATNSYYEPLYSWEWGKPAPEPAAHSGTRVWGTNLTGSYYAREDSFIVSPAIDLSGYADERLVLSWWEWLWTEDTYDYASVEISNNGGTTWQTIHEIQNSSLDRWVKRQVELGMQDAVADFQLRFRMQAQSDNDRLGYYIDDVRIDTLSYACEAETSGVVSGYVYDADTGEGLNKAKLQTSTDTIVGTFQIPNTKSTDTPSNGFYALFLPPGTHVITATFDGSYTTEVQTVTVQANAITPQNFNLSRNWLSAQTHVPDITQQMGTEPIATVPITLYNHLDATTSFTLNERVAGYVSDRLEPVKPLMGGVGIEPPSRQEHQDLSETSPKNLPLKAYTEHTWALNDENELLDVLIVASANTWQIRSHLENYATIHDTTHFNAAMHTPTLETMLEYDAVLVVAEEPFKDPVALGNVLADYIDSGGKVVQTVPTFHSALAGLWDIQGRFATEGYSPLIGTGDANTYAGLGTHEATHPIMQGVVSAGDVLRQHVHLAPGAELIAAWNDNKPFIATKGAVVALNTFLADGAVWNGNIDTIVANSLIWLQSQSDITWLTATPITSTIAAASVITLSLNIDPNIPHMALLGEYKTLIQVVGDTPDKTIYVPINITLTRPDNTPDDILLSTTSIAENAPDKTVVGTFSVQDSASDTVYIAQQDDTYSLVEGAGDIDNDLFTIEDGNTLIARRPLDHETKKACHIRVQVTTPDNRILQKRFSIFIEDHNEAPTDIILNNNTVDENQPEAIDIGTFTALDEDNAGAHTEYISHTYRLVAGEGDDDNSAFMLDGNRLKTNMRLDYEKQPKHSIRVQTSDYDGFAIERIFTIMVQDTFDNQEAFVLPTLQSDTIPLSDTIFSTRTNGWLQFTLGIPAGALNLTRLITNTQVAKGDITNTVVISYTESPPPTQKSYPHDTLAFAGHRFMLDVYAYGMHIPHVTFAVPVSITLAYQDSSMETTEERQLQLYEQTNGMWELVGNYPHGYVYDSKNNTVTIEVDHTGAFALFYEQWLTEHTVYLPLITR